MTIAISVVALTKLRHGQTVADAAWFGLCCHCSLSIDLPARHQQPTPIMLSFPRIQQLVFGTLWFAILPPLTLPRSSQPDWPQRALFSPPIPLTSHPSPDAVEFAGCLMSVEGLLVGIVVLGER